MSPRVKQNSNFYVVGLFLLAGLFIFGGWSLAKWQKQHAAETTAEKTLEQIAEEYGANIEDLEVIDWESGVQWLTTPDELDEDPDNYQYIEGDYLIKVESHKDAEPIPYITVYKHPIVEKNGVRAAVPPPVNFGGTDYYKVDATNSAEDSGSEVCAIATGGSCLGYDDESVTGYNVCKAYNPSAAETSSGSGDASVVYCDGPPQGGVCGGLSNSCHACPACSAGVSCGSAIGGLYREMYVKCAAAPPPPPPPPNTPGTPTTSGVSTSSINVIIDENGNDSSVTYSHNETTTGNYVQAGGALGVSEVFQTYATWGGGSGTNVTGLSQNTQYSFRNRANSSGGTSSFSSTSSSYTLINSCSGASTSGITTTSLQVDASGGFANLASGSSGLNFDETSGNPGGTDSGYQSSTSYVDGGLSVNTQYSYTVTPRNGDAVTAGTCSTSAYTLANTPGAPTVANPSTTTLDVTVDVNSNPAATQFAIQETGTGNYVQAGGALGASPVWQTFTSWGGASGQTVTGLTPSTQYTFQVKARNGDNTETAFGASTANTTLTAAPGTPTVDNPSVSTLDVTIDENGNPSTVEYAIQEVNSGNYVQAGGALGASAVWQTYASWGGASGQAVSGLSENTQYTFRVKARGTDLVETAFSGNASLYTLISAPTGVSFTDVQTAQLTMQATGTLPNLTSGSSGVFFEETSANPGGDDSGYQTSVNYTDTGLSLNTQYSYRAKARNGDGVETTFSSASSSYTLAAIPGAPTVNTPTPSTLNVTIDVNGNPAATEFAIQETTSGNYVQAGGALGASPVWQTNATWGTKTVTGLSENVNYTFRVKARNGDNVETTLSNPTSAATAVDTPTNFQLTDIQTTEMSMSTDTFPNHALGSAGYYFFETGDVFNSGWQSGDNTWTNNHTGSGLSINTQYTHFAKHRNQDAVETGTVNVTAYSLANPPGIPTVNNPTVSSLDVTLDVNSNPAATEFAIQEVNSGQYSNASGPLQVGETWQTNATWGTHSVTSLAENTEYSLRSKARNGDNTETVFSSAANLFTLMAAPTGLNFTNVTDTSIEMAAQGTFNNLAVASSGLLFDETSGNPGADDSGYIQVTTYTDSGLTPNTQYTYRASGRNGDSVTTSFFEAMQYTLATVPAAPTLVSNTADTATLTLNLNGNPASTQLAIQEIGSGNYVQASGVLGAPTVWQTNATWGTVLVTGLTPGETYTFAVKARNADLLETALSPSTGFTTTGPSVQRLQQPPPEEEEITFALIPPAISEGEATAPDTIRWFFDDLAIGESAFDLLDEEGNTIVSVEDVNLTYIEETGLQPNTRYQGRRIVVRGEGQLSDESETFPSVLTPAPEVTPRIIEITANSVTVGIRETIPNLNLGESGLNFELMLTEASGIRAAQVMSSGWIQDDQYTFTDLPEDSEFQARAAARDQDGNETGFSDFSEPQKTGEEVGVDLVVGLSARLADGSSLPEGPIDPFVALSVAVDVVNNGNIDATNVFANVLLPRYINYVSGSLTINGEGQSEGADEDAGQADNNAVSAIWPVMPPGQSYQMNFLLTFDTEALRQLRDETRASANPLISLSASVSSAESMEAVSSSVVSIEPNLELIPEEEPEPEAVEPPLEEISEMLEEIFVEEFGITPPPTPSPEAPPGEPAPTVTTVEEEGFSMDAGEGLGVQGQATSTEEEVTFSGTTTLPFTIVTLIINNNITVVAVSDMNGNWTTTVSADELGVGEGQTAVLDIEAIAAKGSVRSERVGVGSVVVSRAGEPQIVRAIETFVGADITTAVRQVSEQVVQVVEEQEQEIQATLTVAAPVVVVSSAPLLGYLPYLPTLAYHFLTYLVGLFGIKKKKRRFYGVVYDSITKQPLSLAILRFKDAETGKLIKTRVTDNLGRYDVLVDPGQYKLEVIKPQYRFPSSIVRGEQDGDFTNLYRPEEGWQVQEEGLAMPDVALDPVNTKEQWRVSSPFSRIWLALTRAGNYLAAPVMITGTVASALVVAVIPNNPLNWVLAIAYLILLIGQLKLRAPQEKEWGIVYDELTGQPVQLATIQLIDKEFGKVAKSRLTGYQGRYSFLPEPGQYVIKVNKEGYRQLSPEGDEVSVEKENERLTHDIKMESVHE